MKLTHLGLKASILPCIIILTIKLYNLTYFYLNSWRNVMFFKILEKNLRLPSLSELTTHRKQSELTHFGSEAFNCIVYKLGQLGYELWLDMNMRVKFHLKVRKVKWHNCMWSCIVVMSFCLANLHFMYHIEKNWKKYH